MIRPADSPGDWPPRDDRSPERAQVRIGIVPLVDCAPIVVAKSLGFFEQHGLKVELHVEPSWSAVRDKVAFGLLDAAQMLGAMPIASCLGITGVPTPMITALCLNLNGNAVTLSNDLYQQMVYADIGATEPATCGRALARVIERRRSRGMDPLTFATVFGVSSHHYLLRYWMTCAGVDPDRDVRLIVVPPPRMVDHLADGSIDGFCVGEPWNTLAVQRGLGRIVITGYDIHHNGPEKVLGVRRDWARLNPRTHLAMLRALLESCRWLDDPQHRRQAAAMIADRIDAPLPVIEASLLGRIAMGPVGHHRVMPDFHVFSRYAANFPWRSHAAWFVEQMKRSGQVPASVDPVVVAQQVYQPDIFRAAAGSLGLPCPTVDYKPEGLHGAPWILAAATRPIPMGPDLFLDQRRYEFHPPADSALGFAAVEP
jgi:nitrate/nitrite transport system substrate-binding protein